jgi:hypothetical protein
MFQRRDAVSILRVGLSAGANPQLDNLEVVAIHGPMKRSRAVELGRIHIGFLFEQIPERSLVSLHDRVCNITAPGCKNE